ncbi:MAG: hypothetical protein ABJO67_05470 [Pseudoruegeria sp.]
MGSLKTIRHLSVLAALSLLSAQPLAAQSDTPDLQLKFFAGCAGRLSAKMEHQWMFDGPGSESTEKRRNTVVEILEAMIPPDQGRTVLAWRIEAKMAHSALLARAAFSLDKKEADWAFRTAQRMTSECESFLLS